MWGKNLPNTLQLVDLSPTFEVTFCGHKVLSNNLEFKLLLPQTFINITTWPQTNFFAWLGTYLQISKNSHSGSHKGHQPIHKSEDFRKGCFSQLEITTMQILETNLLRQHSQLFNHQLQCYIGKSRRALAHLPIFLAFYLQCNSGHCLHY